ncbi:MAG TPA: lytic transglycosylase [Spirochaetaceae bacterium]|nr:lytic transglycosylase [Spirochaetaceae bacterium]HAW85905.1 lytic transglycosylase [Spirochaetaceae bacterium]HBO40514.1 lytic transglycosylase [Spirochaetaceae bacterium]HCQ86326.1 lytic transglycosylase [Spirochaetaceae bacterium]
MGRHLLRREAAMTTRPRRMAVTLQPRLRLPLRLALTFLAAGAWPLSAQTAPGIPASPEITAAPAPTAVDPAAAASQALVEAAAPLIASTSLTAAHETPPPEPLALPLRPLRHSFPDQANTTPPSQTLPGTPDFRHHAWPERLSLPPPLADAHYDRFVTLYCTDGGRAWLESVLLRSRPYSAYILDRIRYYGLPEELFFIPFIESEFQPRAVSRSGAMGLWQFMRNSISGFGMRIDEWRDDRRDFMKSTDGALRKLRGNYRHFGDWLLAIAAYNCGVGALERAIVRAGGERDFWRLKAAGVLPAETAVYIPKFLAVAGTALHGGRHGLEPDWSPGTVWTQLPLDGPVDLELLAEAIGLPAELLKTGNPELTFGVTPPEGDYALKLPLEYAAQARLALASASNLVRVYVYYVKSGDTLSAIARHYGVSLTMIGRLNPGLRPDLIRIGQRLVIPALNDRTPYPGAPVASGQVFGGTYLVQTGDSLWSIAQRFTIAVERLASQNQLTLNSILREGMQLDVPIMNQ